MGGGERRKCKAVVSYSILTRVTAITTITYCSVPACRAARKAASQASWLARPESRDDFRGPVYVARVQTWCRAIRAQGVM
jgi:hypothetical protein